MKFIIYLWKWKTVTLTKITEFQVNKALNVLGFDPIYFWVQKECWLEGGSEDE